MPSAARHLSIAMIIEAYDKYGSVWKAGEELGVDGRAISLRLKEVGHNTRAAQYFSDAEKEKISSLYKNSDFETFDLEKIARELGRSKIAVCRIAGVLGLTIQGRSTKKVVAAGRAGGIGKWSKRPHPRGALGMVHTNETIEAVSRAAKRMWSTHKTFEIGLMSPEARDKRSKMMSERAVNRPARSAYSRCKAGYRDDLGEIYFRSSWEANYARYLNLLQRMRIVEKWEYEPKTFWFDGVRRGTMSYRPDFCVTYRNEKVSEYVEIKGWVLPKDRTKWKRMAQYHPDIKLVVVGKKQYRNIERKWSSALPGWEHGRAKVSIERDAAVSCCQIEITARDA